MCSTDDDCNLNGVCDASSGSCACAGEWSGDTCGLLNLEPARPPPGSGLFSAVNSSWGGSIIQDPQPAGDGVYHMFASRFAGHCGLHSWLHNSEVIRATSVDPEGPYEYAETVLPVFAHGPSVRRMPDGSFILMHLGCGHPNRKTPFIKGCSNGTTPAAEGLGQHSPPSSSLRPQPSPILPACDQFSVFVLTAPSLLGPWSPANKSGNNSSDSGNNSKGGGQNKGSDSGNNNSNSGGGRYWYRRR